MRGLWSAVPAILTTVSAIPAQAGSGPALVVPISSNDAVGLSVSRKARDSSVAAGVGMWSDDGALELGGFQDGPARDVAPIARAAELVSGKAMRSRGLRLSGAFHRSGANAHGWSVGFEARRQKISDIGAALSGHWRTSSDSRVLVSGKLKF